MERPALFQARGYCTEQDRGVFIVFQSGFYGTLFLWGTSKGQTFEEEAL